MPASYPYIRKLLCLAEGVCESEEIIIRAIFDKKIAEGDPQKLKDTQPAKKQFYPRFNKDRNLYESGLSVIHEDGRISADICAIASTINARPLQLLSKVAVQHIKNEFPHKTLQPLDVIRDDVGYEGHAEIREFPHDWDICTHIGNQLHRIFREFGEVQHSV